MLYKMVMAALRELLGKHHPAPKQKCETGVPARLTAGGNLIHAKGQEHTPSTRHILQQSID